jgi:hypothetical protein
MVRTERLVNIESPQVAWSGSENRAGQGEGDVSKGWLVRVPVIT